MTITDIRTNDRTRTETAEYLAERFCEGMRALEDGDLDRATDAFTEVDRGQFRHLDRNQARAAAVAHVEALRETDRIACESTVDGAIDPDLAAAADWEPVRSAFERRQRVVGLDDRYAETHTRAWRNHTTGDDYWTRHMEALCYEVRAAMGDPTYPNKPSDGHAGFGPEPARYALAVELRSVEGGRSPEQHRRNMQRYFEAILEAHGV